MGIKNKKGLNVIFSIFLAVLMLVSVNAYFGTGVGDCNGRPYCFDNCVDSEHCSGYNFCSSGLYVSGSCSNYPLFTGKGNKCWCVYGSMRCCDDDASGVMRLCSRPDYNSYCCTPSTEVCDGIDNDCDGNVDENNAGCSSEEPYCVSGSCLECETNQDCDNGLYCDGAEYCDQNGDCQQGTPPTGDGIDCTIDNCDEITDTITHLPDKSLCQDGLWCNGQEVCDISLGCQPGAIEDCSDSIACTLNSCDEGTILTDNLGTCQSNPDSCDCQSNSDCPDDENPCTTAICNANYECENIPANNGLECDDGFFCTINDRCSEGNCIADQKPVNDGIDCTSDSCDEDTLQILHIPDNSLCNDGLYCNGQEICDESKGCQQGTPPMEDGIDCTIGSCNEETDAVTNSINDFFCQDGSWCNGAEICDFLLGCQPRPAINCDDYVSCSTDMCTERGDLTDNVGECIYDTASCDCTINSDCDDQNPCTEDICTVGYVCEHSPINDGMECDDGLFCTINDRCLAGECIADPVIANDGIACTLDSCNEETDELVYLPDDSLCQNDLYCDGQEVCNVSAGCQQGIPPAKDDGVGCTIDNCNELTDTITHTSDNSLCQDGLWCNGQETCDTPFGCQLGTAPNCADAVDCTEDTCEEGQNETDNIGFCQHDPSACTGCIIDSDCNDFNPCTDDVCNATYECENTPNDANVCDDGASCTINDRCSAGECISDSVSVDDGISCTIDSCDEASDEILHLPDNSLCQDGLWCNGQEACDTQRDCIQGTSPSCSDSLDCSVDTCDEGQDETDNLGICIQDTDPCCIDEDNDNYGSNGLGYCSNPEQDCNDNLPEVNPGAIEICYNQIDDDCDGRIDNYDFDCNSPPVVEDILFNPSGSYGGQTVRIYCNALDQESQAITVYIWLATNNSIPWNRINGADISSNLIDSLYYYDFVVPDDPVDQAYKAHCQASDSYLIGEKREDPTDFTIINQGPTANLLQVTGWFNHSFLLSGDSFDTDQQESSLFNRLTLKNESQIIIPNTNMFWNPVSSDHLLSLTTPPGIYNYSYLVEDSQGAQDAIYGSINLNDILPPCGLRETLCIDGTCSNNCNNTDTGPSYCINDVPNGVCEFGEGCACEDCERQQDNCETGLICYAGKCTDETLPPCPAGTTLCSDNICRADCGTNYNCNDDTVCDAGEGCECSDCYNQDDTCESGLICDPATETCYDPIHPPCPAGTTLCSDNICRADCGSLTPGCDGNCTNGINDSCLCPECNGLVDTCIATAMCANNLCCVSAGSETCGDGIDNDCDGSIDEDCSGGGNTPSGGGSSNYCGDGRCRGNEDEENCPRDCLVEIIGVSTGGRTFDTYFEIEGPSQIDLIKGQSKEVVYTVSFNTKVTGLTAVARDVRIEIPAMQNNEYSIVPLETDISLGSSKTYKITFNIPYTYSGRIYLYVNGVKFEEGSTVGQKDEIRKQVTLNVQSESRVEEPREITPPQEPATEEGCQMFSSNYGKFGLCWYIWVILFVMFFLLLAFFSIEDVMEEHRQDRKLKLSLVYGIALGALLIAFIVIYAFAPIALSFAILFFIELLALIYFVADYTHFNFFKIMAASKVNPVLVNYIKKELQANYSLESIKSRLYSQGYTKEQVERAASQALKELKGDKK